MVFFCKFLLALRWQRTTAVSGVAQYGFQTSSNIALAGRRCFVNGNSAKYCLALVVHLFNSLEVRSSSRLKSRRFQANSDSEDKIVMQVIRQTYQVLSLSSSRHCFTSSSLFICIYHYKRLRRFQVTHGRTLSILPEKEQNEKIT